MKLTALNRSTLVVGATLALIGLVLVFVLSCLWGIRSGFVAEIERLEPQIARLQGIALSEEQLTVANQMLGATLEELAYLPDGETAMVAAAMQQTIRQVVSEAGFTVAGSQILPAAREGDLQLLRLDLTVSGNVDALDASLVRLRDLRPMVIIESAELKPARVRRKIGRAADQEDVRQITGRFKLLSLRIIE